MPRLTDVEFAHMILGGMSPAAMLEVIEVAILEIDEPIIAAALRDASHRIARHADELERLLVDGSSGAPHGQCLPDKADVPAPGHLPQGARPLAFLGAFLGASHEA